MLEMLGEVYRYDAEARDGVLTAPERFRFHQEHSGPVMEKLHGWLEAHFAERKTEPDSGLGKAITHVLRHWKADAARGRGGRPVYDADPHLPVMWRQLV